MPGETSQEKAVATEWFNQNQDLFWKYTAANGALKKQIIQYIDPIFLSPIKDKLTGFLWVKYLETMNNLFRTHREIDNINFEENAVRMMVVYNPAKNLKIFNRTARNGPIVCVRRWEDHCRHDDEIEGYCPYLPNWCLKWQHTGVVQATCRPKYVVCLQGFISLNAPRTTVRGDNGGKGGVHGGSTERLGVPPFAPTEYHNKAIESLRAMSQGTKEQRY